MKKWFYDQVRKESAPISEAELRRNRLIALAVFAGLVALWLVQRGI